MSYIGLAVTLTWWWSLVRIQSCLPNKIRSAGGLEGRSERVALFRFAAVKALIEGRRFRRRATTADSTLASCRTTASTLDR